MGKLLMLAIIGLLLLLPVLAVEPTGSTSYQAWVSVERADFGGDAPYIKLKAYYTADTIVSSNQGNGVGGGDIFRSESRPLTNAVLALTFDGQNLTDKYGAPICQNMVTAAQAGFRGGLAVDPGDAVCAGSGPFYARDPDPAAGGAPRRLSNWTGCGMLQVNLLSSPDQGSIQSLHAPAMMYCPSQPKNLGLYNLLGLAQLSPTLIAACLPIFLVLGLLIASMYQRGKDPLMLFDITTPRLPTMRKVRMKPVTQPFHLAGKGRMADRVIGRSEKGIAASVFALYGGKRAGEAAARARADAMALFPKKTMKPDEYRKAMERLHDIMDKAGASRETRDRAWAAAMRLMQVREAMLIDKEAHLYARTPEAGFSRKVGAAATNWGNKLAKPWKFFWKDTEKADMLPGIPYVERTGMVISGWLASRAGNIALRRQIRNTALAEVGVATGLLKREGKFAKQHAFENKRLGHIPHIVEKLRNESYLLGRAIMDEHVRALMTAAVMEQEEKGGSFKINEARMRELLGMIEKARGDARGNMLEFRRILGEKLHEYFTRKENAGIVVYNAAGDAADREAFLKQFKEHMGIVYNILKADGHATGDGMLPGFSDAAKKMNPDDVYGRYNKLVDLTAVYAKDAREGAGKGRVPMVYLGHDLAELLGRAVSVRHLEGKLDLRDEGSRLMHIRYRMEEEVMRRRLFEYAMGERNFKDKDGRTNLEPLGMDRMLNTTWMKELRGVLAVEKIRLEPAFDYARRSEWAARNYLTGYNASTTGYSAEAERNKIEILRQGLAFATGQGYETFFRNYWTQVERNQLTYLTMREMSKFYTGQDWNADGYEAWKKRGVTYGDVQKGVWLIGGERVLTPLPSGVYRDEQGRIVGAFLKQERIGDVERVDYRSVQTQTEAKTIVGKDGKLLNDGRPVYEHSAYSALMSDYADRPINLSLLFRTRDEKSFKPGSPMDRETRLLSQQLQAAWADMTGPAYGMANLASYKTDEQKRRALESLQSLAGGAAEARVTGRELSREQISANIRKIENMLYSHVQMTTRSSLKDDPNQTWQTRYGSRATQFLERVMRGGVTETDERLHQWYASQAYARTVLQTFGKDWNEGIFHSDAVKESLDAKKKLGELRGEQLELLKQTHLTADQQRELAQLRTKIASQMQAVQNLEQKSRDYQKDNLYVDRQLKRVADLWIPFYNTAEQTNMRDPRVAFGGGYAMGPAMMVGYQTGQFVGERPQMWAGYSINPGDKMINVLARPSQWAATVFGAHTRTFFTKMTGYTTVYHVDPERGISGTNTHEQGVVEAFQSLFKPSQTIGLLTRLNLKPLVRTKFKNEFGLNVSEEDSWFGKDYNWPVTFRSGGQSAGAAETINRIDTARYAQMGLDAAKAKRQTKTGLTFREEYMLWDQRDKAEFQQDTKANIEAMKQRMNTLSDPTERRMLQYQIRETENVAQATRKAWSMPILRGFSRQGYYGVENRSDWDQALSGGAHRPWEMMAPYHKNIDTGMVPGMIATDAAGYIRMYPRVSRTVSGAWEFIDGKGEQQSRMYQGAPKGPFGSGGERHETSPLRKYEQLEYGINPDTGRAQAGLGMRNPWLGAAGSSEYLTQSGMGRDLFRDALRDVYRRETPLLPKMIDLEMQRQSWSFQNSEYVIPLAPLYLGIYHIFRHSSKLAREQSWNRDHPTERDYGELTPEDKRRNAAMRSEMMKAGDSTYSCPTHGIILRGGQACPICRSDEALKAEKENTFLKRAPARKLEQIKDWAKSWMSLAPGLPGYYNNYMDQAHCSTHQIGYPRGTSCPLCMEKGVRASRSETERHKMEDLNGKLKEYAKDIDGIYKDRRISELERGRKIAKKVDEREKAVEDSHVSIERDTRIGFRPGRAYLQAEMERLKKEEKENSYTIR